jgi:hypothetical protein
MAGGGEDFQGEAVGEVNPLPVPDDAVDRDRAPNQFVEARDRPFAGLTIGIFDPGPFARVRGHGTCGGLPDRPDGTNVVGMGVGEHEKGDLFRPTAGPTDAVEDTAFRTGHPAVDEADLAAVDEEDVDEPCDRPPPRRCHLEGNLYGMDMRSDLHLPALRRDQWVAPGQV